MTVQELSNLLNGTIRTVLAECARRGFDYDKLVEEHAIAWYARDGNGQHERLKQFPGGLLFSEVLRVLERAREMTDLHTVVEHFLLREAKLPAWFLYWNSDRAVGDLIYEYLKRKNALELDERLVEQISREYIDDHMSSRIRQRSVVRLEGFSSPNSFNVSDTIVIRPIERRDIEQFGKKTLRSSNTELPVKEDDWICEMSHAAPKSDMLSLDLFRDMMDSVATALQLSATGRAIFKHLGTMSISPFFDTGTMWSSGFYVTRRTGSTMDLTSERIVLIRENYERIQRIKSTESLEYLRLPLRRLRLSSERKNDDDSLIDNVIGLERLLCPDIDRHEAAFRFRLRGAALLPESYGTDRMRIDLMKNLYDLRSSVVHGNPDATEVAVWSERSEKILKEIFSWYLNRMDAKSNREGTSKLLDNAMVKGGRAWAGF